MSLITLPNSAEWDTEKTLSEQTEDAMEYVQGLIDAGETVSFKEYCGDDLESNAVERVTKSVFEDAPNNLKLEIDYEYVHASDHKACFARKGSTHTIIETE